MMNWLVALWSRICSFLDSCRAGTSSILRACSAVLSKHSAAEHVVQKSFVFSETGHIMIATTATRTDDIPQEVKDVFAEVTVFFAAMIKAITSTPDPKSTWIPGMPPPEKQLGTNRNLQSLTPRGMRAGVRNHSLFDHCALSDIIAGSGYFLPMSEEELQLQTGKCPSTFSRDFVATSLGLPSGIVSAGLAKGMICSMTQFGLILSHDFAREGERVATIFFVCEYLTGIPLVSVTVVSMDVDSAAELFLAAPWSMGNGRPLQLILRKETFLFVSPGFIGRFGGELNKGIASATDNSLVSALKQLMSSAHGN